jgi:hypothetical protein
MARKLGRSPSTVAREISRNGGYDRYRASSADETAWVRARRPNVVSWRLTRICGKRLRGAERQLVARADRGLAEECISWRRGISGVPRNDLSQLICSSPWGA